MKSLRRNRKALKRVVILAAVLLTATILTVVTTIQNQNAYPLINLYLQSVSQSSNNIIQEKYLPISSDYNFTENIYQTINVIADNIVINGNGYTLQGSGSDYGFYINGRHNVTITNVTVTGWKYGFYLLYSSNNTLSGNTANKNKFQGFSLNFGYNNTLSGNTANNNGIDGFNLFATSKNTLSGNTANNNLRYGFHIHHSSNNNIKNNTVNNNGYYGFYLNASTGNKLQGNTALNSVRGGYYWTADSINNDFTGSVEANYLRVKVVKFLGYPISGADVKVETDGTVVYKTPHFSGTNSTTDSDGATPWIIVPYKTFTTNDTMTRNITTVTVWNSTASFFNNPRTVNMYQTHVETFRLTSQLPVVFFLLILFGMQGGDNPLFYVVLSVAGFECVVFAFLSYHFRKLKA
ncbi:MAG: NosD domain-containing protein [Candidatus Jordarchaeaceae archaeon]